MRFLFVLIVIINLGLLAYGQGFFGTPPAEQGRASQVLVQRNAHLVVPGAPLAASSGDPL
ncbi:MAG: hypothetical protein WCY98_03025 [Castellaniella sp.]